jgi:isopentenyldiphosphate isomerase
MGVDGIKIKPLVKFKMNYGINDNEISVLYKGFVHPSKVKIDPIEIEQVAYYSIDEIKEMMKSESIFCGWFIQIMNWYTRLPTELTVLKVH